MSRFTVLYKKCCLQLIQIFLWNCHFFKLLRNTNFPSISELLSERVNFLIKRDYFSEFPRKCFKATGKHSLAVCGSFGGEKTVFVNFIFVQFYWFDQKQLFKEILIFLRICSFSNLLRKTNFLIISKLLSGIICFTKKITFPRHSLKILQNTRKA